MPLDFQTVPVTFNQGLDTKTQRKLVPAGKWDTLENFTLSQEDSLQLRDGMEPLIAGTTCNSLAAYNNELVGVTESVAFAVDQTTGTTFSRSGRLGNVLVDKRQLYMSQGMLDSLDCAHGDGYTAYVWREYNPIYGTMAGIYCSVVEEASGAIVLTRTAISAISTAASPRVVYVGGAFFFFWYTSAGQTILGTAIATSAPGTLGTNVALVNLVHTNTSTVGFEVCTFDGQPFVTYMAATPDVKAFTVTRTGTTVAVDTAAATIISDAEVTTNTIGGLACAQFGSTLRCGVFLTHTAGGTAGAGIVGVVVDDTLAVTTAATQIDSATPPVTGATHITALAGTTVAVYADQISSYNSANFRPVRGVQVTSTLVVASGPTTILNSSCFRVNGAEASGPQGPFIAGKPFRGADNNTYLPMVVLENYASVGSNTATTSAQSSFFLYRATLGLSVFPVASALYGAIGVYSPSPPTITVVPPCSTPAVGDGFRIALPEIVDLQTRGIINVSPIGASSLMMTPNKTEPVAADQLQQSLFMAGGQLASYDGANICEHGFSLFPEGISVVVSAPGGLNDITVGDHQLCAVYEWIDGAGQRHQSAPSLPVSFTVANTTDILTIVVPTLLISNKTGITISLYMTLAGGLTFYRLMPSYTAISNTTAASTVTATTAGFVVNDATISTAEQLYTQPYIAGTSLPNFAPGPSSALKSIHSRIWFKRDDQPYRYGYSLPTVNATGLRFNPALGGVVPSNSGGVVTFEQLDEKAIIFCARVPYVVYGTGPNASGAFNNYSEPQEVPSDVGCSSAESVLRMPKGIIFKSAKGWYLLGRDLSARYIGDGVAQWDSYEVASAVMMGDRQECRFGLVGGPTLVYCYELDQWCTTAYLAGDYEPTTAVWWPGGGDAGRYTHASNAAGIMWDVPGSQTDDISSSPEVIRTVARTPWLHLSKLEGFQRLRRMYWTATGTSPTSSVLLSVVFDDDYNGGATGSYTVSISLSPITFSPSGVIDLRHRLTRQKCKSVAFTFTETCDDPEGTRTTGMQAMLLEVGTKRGTNKLPATQTVG